jgi:hypothetical protein
VDRVVAHLPHYLGDVGYRQRPPFTESVQDELIERLGGRISHTHSIGSGAGAAPVVAVLARAQLVTRWRFW